MAKASAYVHLDQLAIACTVGADLCVCPGLYLQITTGSPHIGLPRIGSAYTVGADLCVCPGLYLQITTGVPTHRSPSDWVYKSPPGQTLRSAPTLICKPI